jgi:NADH:ubiquinone oxidoreductase subunit 6 (subunit J)
MILIGLMVGLVICAILAVRAQRLLTAAIWLASASILVSSSLYLLGARELAVIELSVGAGLVTVLFVYAITIASDEAAVEQRSVLPRPLAGGLAVSAVLLLSWLALPLPGQPATTAQATFRQMLWQQRGADVLLQIVLLFIGAVGVLGLLATDHRPPTTGEELAAGSFVPRPIAPLTCEPSSVVQTPEPEAAREEVEV